MQAIPMVRHGDFYEAYRYNAEVLARELNLTVSGVTRDGERVLMAGFPYHAADRYVAALEAKGYAVIGIDRPECDDEDESEAA